jgi:uncharacterized repeat protein (TIGR04002 family)
MSNVTKINSEASVKEAAEKGNSNREVLERETLSREASDKKASDKKVSDKEATDKETTDKETSSNKNLSKEISTQEDSKTEKSIVNKKTATNKRLKRMVIAAVFAALITLMTAYICHIPVSANGGYIHFGDGLIYIVACLIPKPYAILAASIGGGLADLLTAPLWVIPTIFVKMLITIPFTSKQKNIVNKRNIIAAIAAYFISATGYFLAETLVLGYEVAFFTSFAGSFIQSFGSAIVFVAFGMALDKVQVKKRLAM